MEVVRRASCVLDGRRLYAVCTASAVSIGCVYRKHPERVPPEMGWIRRDCRPVSLNIVKTLVYACVSLLTNSTHVAPGCPRKSGPMTWITEMAPRLVKPSRVYWCSTAEVSVVIACFTRAGKSFSLLMPSHSYSAREGPLAP